MRVCRFCGQQRVKSKHGPATCIRCQRERENERGRHRYREQHPKSEDGKRTCKTCGRACTPPHEIRPRGKRCFECQRAHHRAKYRQRQARLTPAQRKAERQRHNANQRRLRQDPKVRAKRAAESRRWRAENPERALEATRNWRRKMMRNPKRHAEYKENQRIYQRLWRERKGDPIPAVPPEIYANGNGRGSYAWGYGRVPVQPLSQIVNEWLGGDATQRRHGQVYGQAPPAGMEQLADLSGVDPRVLYAIVHAERATVTRDIADRLCTAMSVPLAMLEDSAA